MEKLVWKMRNLKAIEKLVLDYLVTNHHGNSIGYYYLPFDYIVVDLGLERNSIEEAIDSLVEKNLIAYDQQASVVAIANYDRYVTFDNRTNPAEIIIDVPTSSVFVTCLKWLSDYIGGEAAKNMVTSRWVKDAIGMKANTSGANELTKVCFYLFWAIYPKKANKESAIRNYLEIIEKGEFLPAQILDAVVNYATECGRLRFIGKNVEDAAKFLDPQEQPFKEYIGRISHVKEIENIKRRSIADLAPLRVEMEEDCPF